MSYTQRDDDTETGQYRTEHRRDAGDTTWYHDYEVAGRKRRCVLNTEVWYNPRKPMPASPVAVLFGQFLASGVHIVKCRWESLP